MPRSLAFAVVGRIEPDDPHRLAVGGEGYVVAGDHIVAGLYPAAAVAFFTGVADAALADEIDLGVPLSIAAAVRAAGVKIAGARAHRYAVKRMRIGGAGAVDDVGGVGHGVQPLISTKINF